MGSTPRPEQSADTAKISKSRSGRLCGKKAKAIIHDPLEIGTAMMAVNSALFSMR